MGTHQGAEGKTIREIVGHTRKEAQRALDALRGDVARRRYRVLQDKPFDASADEWLAAFTRKANSKRAYTPRRSSLPKPCSRSGRFETWAPPTCAASSTTSRSTTAIAEGYAERNPDELVALQWGNDVDLLNRELHVRQTYTSTAPRSLGTAPARTLVRDVNGRRLRALGAERGEGAG